MLETLKKELYAHTKKNSALNQELGQKDNRLDDALGEVNTLRVRCDDLTRDKAALEAAVAKAEAELAEARYARVVASSLTDSSHRKLVVVT